MNEVNEKYAFAQNAIEQVKAELTDLVFQRIESDKALMTEYLHRVSESDWGTVNRTIGEMVKKSLGLSNLCRDNNPNSKLILSYTQFS